MEKQGRTKRMAVLVGCNYPNTPNELHGCINDVLAMQKTLIKTVWHLSSLTSINTSDIGTHLLEFFGHNASLKFLLPNDEQEWSTLQPDAGILLSGCQANETSADMSPNGNGENNKKAAYGAFSNAVQMVLKDNSGPLSNKEIVMMARKILQAQRVEQHPCLYCSDDNSVESFLCQQEEIKAAQICDIWDMITVRTYKIDCVWWFLLIKYYYIYIPWLL